MNRARLLAGALLLLGLAGCGGSVADRDRPSPTRAQPEPASPFCAAVQASNTALAPLATPGGIPADELASTADAVRRSTTQLLNAAPEEIRGDVERYNAVVDLQLDALVANGGDSAALARDTALTAQINTPENTTANQRVRAYVTENCVAR